MRMEPFVWSLILVAALALLGFANRAAAETTWHIALPESSADDEARKVCLEDLREAGARRGVTFETITDTEPSQTNLIIVGSPERNVVTHTLQATTKTDLSPHAHPQGYRIRALRDDGLTVVVVAGGSLIGDVYGLYWIWDRLRVTGHVPTVDVDHAPALETRYTRIAVRTTADIRRALRYRLNLVYGENPLNLVPWDSEPERTENAQHRKATKELADYAHKLHMRFLAFGTDFTYHPSLIEEFGATLSPADPRFWQAVQAKYRRLLEAVPELDGVGTFVSEEQNYWGDYATFDPMHDGEDCDWSLEKRYRTFIKAVWDVVAGEHDKLLLHRTWDTNPYEHQSQPEVYARTFTSEVPTKNLYLIPSFTQNDRWWFQPYNPTFNRTEHAMMAVCETMDYHAGGALFPTYPGTYFQAGFESILGVQDSNFKGASLDMPSQEAWDTRSMTAYTVARLSWDYQDDPEAIARDFCAIHFGERAADAMAEICMLSPVAYKYGLYIEPAAYGTFSSLPHIRVGRFIAEGYPRIDHGTEHVAFLRNLYLRCKPWLPETLLYLDHGLDTARRMESMFAEARPLIADADAAAQIKDSLALTRLLVHTNNAYVKTFFAYFQYREGPSDANRQALHDHTAELRDVRDAFANAPGFGYQLFGVDQLLVNAQQALDNLDEAEALLGRSLSPKEIESAVVEQQRHYRDVLDKHRDRAVKCLYWEGRVDGRNILVMQGDAIRIEHLRWDPVYVQDHTVFAPLPAKAVTVVPEDIESEPMHPFVLEQPSADNDYTVRVYMNDVPGGAHWFKFNLYYIDADPADLGLAAPW